MWDFGARAMLQLSAALFMQPLNLLLASEALPHGALSLHSRLGCFLWLHQATLHYQSNLCGIEAWMLDVWQGDLQAPDFLQRLEPDHIVEWNDFQLTSSHSLSRFRMCMRFRFLSTKPCPTYCSYHNSICHKFSLCASKVCLLEWLHWRLSIPAYLLVALKSQDIISLDSCKAGA